MNIAASKIWLLQKLDRPCGWTFVIRFAFCGVATFLNGIDVASQGNTMILSGWIIGLALGAAWSVLLLFGPAILARNIHPSLKAALWGTCSLTALALLGIICFQIWGQQRG
jgi:hypothetical protein